MHLWAQKALESSQSFHSECQEIFELDLTTIVTRNDFFFQNKPFFVG